jgi:hypothetical protein
MTTASKTFMAKGTTKAHILASSSFAGIDDIVDSFSAIWSVDSESTCK